MKIKIGSRRSQLALWQTHYVAEKLKSEGLEIEIIEIDTIGDKVLNTSISKIGSKGVFTEEIEGQLKDGSIDIAVHSAKDMQSKLPDGFDLIAFTKREKAGDVILGKESNILERRGAVIGTSSTRRKALFKRYYPHLKIKDIRGNLNTRVQKLQNQEYDAIALAFAGVKRLGWEEQIQVMLPEDIFVPAVGQGIVAVECHSSLEVEKREKIRSIVNDIQTELLITAERRYLSIMNGGCSIPIFAHCTKQGDDFVIQGGIIDLEGKREIKTTVSSVDSLKAGDLLAKEVTEAGGLEILNEIRKQQSNE